MYRLLSPHWRKDWIPGLIDALEAIWKHTRDERWQGYQLVLRPRRMPSDCCDQWTWLPLHSGPTVPSALFIFKISKMKMFHREGHYNRQTPRWIQMPDFFFSGWGHVENYLTCLESTNSVSSWNQIRRRILTSPARRTIILAPVNETDETLRRRSWPASFEIVRYKVIFVCKSNPPCHPTRPSADQKWLQRWIVRYKSPLMHGEQRLKEALRTYGILQEVHILSFRPLWIADPRETSTVQPLRRRKK